MAGFISKTEISNTTKNANLNVVDLVSKKKIPQLEIGSNRAAADSIFTL